ncbi:protein-S-isoprenylcysteine O-methyltransferase [uncultured Roseobacter sp.]|uniref:protein-S-isoprenylcysteine O-methyltransferase n=1 Tax=uncultured Roseobacter sp. TaxID=114847 RepID=UPI00260C43F8|nr:protein-S-isoprenylcysteine O-methyltransferase [uncultured Roseobacter sp.]
MFWVFLVVLGACLIWRLPINGWGSLIWFTGSVALFVIRHPHQTKTQDMVTAQRFNAGTEQLLLILVTLGMQVIPGVHLVTGLLEFADHAGGTVAPAIGFFALLTGLWLFWRSHVDLGRNWSVTLELRQYHGLITKGVYTHIRHPMYTAIFLISTAQLLLIANWIAGPAALIAFSLMCIFRIPQEERMMKEQFGDRYQQYMDRTRRFFPKVY